VPGSFRDMAPLLGKTELDGLDCRICGARDGRTYFRARCHPRARLHAAYQRGTVAFEGAPGREVGILVLECATCGREVVRIAVAG
jgi:hypothetical protein